MQLIYQLSKCCYIAVNAIRLVFLSIPLHLHLHLHLSICFYSYFSITDIIMLLFGCNHGKNVNANKFNKLINENATTYQESQDSVNSIFSEILKIAQNESSFPQKRPNNQVRFEQNPLF